MFIRLIGFDACTGFKVWSLRSGQSGLGVQGSSGSWGFKSLGFKAQLY